MKTLILAALLAAMSGCPAAAPALAQDVVCQFTARPAPRVHGPMEPQDANGDERFIS